MEEHQRFKIYTTTVKSCHQTAYHLATFNSMLEGQLPDYIREEEHRAPQAILDQVRIDNEIERENQAKRQEQREKEAAQRRAEGGPTFDGKGQWTYQANRNKRNDDQGTENPQDRGKIHPNDVVGQKMRQEE